MYFRLNTHRFTTVSCAWLKIGKLKQPINKHISLLMSYAVERYPRRVSLLPRRSSHHQHEHNNHSTSYMVHDIISGLSKTDYDFTQTQMLWNISRQILRLLFSIVNASIPIDYTSIKFYYYYLIMKTSSWTVAKSISYSWRWAILQLDSLSEMC